MYCYFLRSNSYLGTFTGPLADKFGRKKLTLVFCVLYAVCCFIKFTKHFWVLLGGRLLGGISTSLLFSVFESWYVNEHVNQSKVSLWPLSDQSSKRINYILTTLTLSVTQWMDGKNFRHYHFLQWSKSFKNYNFLSDQIYSFEIWIGTGNCCRSGCKLPNRNIGVRTEGSFCTCNNLLYHLLLHRCFHMVRKLWQSSK